MAEPMPVVRELYKPALLPQCVVIALLSSVSYLLFPEAGIGVDILAGTAAYFVICRVMRLLFVRQHTMGMVAYREGQFREAIGYFEGSRLFFMEHAWLDRLRWWIFGVASRSPYRVIALGNMAFCYGQLGEGGKAIEIFEKVLVEMPGHKGAMASLRMLRAGMGAKGAVPAEG